jgi:hypothetical protein
MNNPMTPAQALQILSDATEPRNINAISRQGYIAIQQAIEVLAKAITPNAESSDEGRESIAEPNSLQPSA